MKKQADIMSYSGHSFTISPPQPRKVRAQSVWHRLQFNPLYTSLKKAPRWLSVGLLIGLPALWLFSLHLLPLFKMGQIAFLAEYPLPLHSEQRITTEHFSILLNDKSFVIPLIRTFALAAATALLTLIAALPIAWLIARHSSQKSKMRKLLILMAPFWAGELVRAFALVLIGANKGLVNEALKAIGLIDSPLPLLYNVAAVHFGMFYFLILYQALPLYNAITKIPVSVSEAAADLRAGPWRRLFFVTLPLLRPAIAASTTLVFLMALGAYSVPLLLGGTDSVLFAQTIATVFNSGADTWPQGAAFSVVLLGLSFISAALWFRLIAGKEVKS